MEDLEAAWHSLRQGIKISPGLPHLAAEVLANGFDSPTLRELAGLGVHDDVEARRLLPVALVELGYSLDPVDEPWGEVVPWDEYRAQFDPDLVDRTERALVVVQRDLDQVRAEFGRLTLYWSGRYDDDGEPQLLVGFNDEPFLFFDGSNPTECLSGQDLPRRVLSIAWNAQNCIMEMFQSFWPTCPLHRRGLHLPKSDSEWEESGWPAWRCRAEGGHDIALVGELGKDLGPVQRRGEVLARGGGHQRPGPGLGVEPVRLLFERTALPMALPRRTVGAFYLHWWVCAVDGTTLLVPDTKKNTAAFGKPGNDQGEGALPQVRVLGLVECGTRALLAAAFGGTGGSKAVSEQALFPGLFGAFSSL